MVLNKTSYAHKTIRTKSEQLELISEMKIFTNLDEQFDQIRYYNKYGYILIDYKHSTVYTLGHHLNDIELQLVSDIILHLQWLEIGIKYQKRRG